MKDVKSIFADVKAFFSELCSSIKNGSVAEFAQNHKKQLIGCVCGIAGIIVLVLILSLCVSIVRNRTQKITAIVPPLEEPLIMPKEPGINDNFQFYREQKSEWTKEDAEKWFTAPDDSMIVELEEANNAIISDILGVAP